MTRKKKYIYAFGGGATEGMGEQKELLGGKGAGLAEMSRLGIPVPPGFTLTTAVCTYYHGHERSYPPTLKAEFRQHLSRIEEEQGQIFGDPQNPLLVSVRSGAPASMPGMMDTVLNLGLNDEIVAAQTQKGLSPWFLKDCYRRLIAMFSDVVLGVPFAGFEEILTAARQRQGVATDPELSTAALDEVIAEYYLLLADRGVEFPQDPAEQLWAAVGAVFDSWHNRRAQEYRRLHEIPEDQGTGVNVQSMVFGNRGPRCATGVAFTRDPSTGERRLYGEYLVNAQGEDVVAGIRTPHPILPGRSGSGGGGADDDGGERQGLAAEFPEAFRELEEVCTLLERHFRNMQDLEFTIQDGKLYMLQTRAGKRSGPAAVRIAVEMEAERLIHRREALKRVEPQHLIQMMAPVFDEQEKRRAVQAGRLLGSGLAAGPGAASGKIAFTAERAAEMAPHGPVVLVRNETSPEDIVGMHASSGILTTRGGMTSHAAVVARGMGKPCVVGAGALTVDDQRHEVRVAGRVIREGEKISIDGTSGEVIEGGLLAHPSEVLQALVEGGGNDPSAGSPAVQGFQRLLGWADRERRLRVRANADTPEDAAIARTFGAEGIGLCRTEHMFFQEDRIPWVRQMILSQDQRQRSEALDHLLLMQQADFEGIFRALEGLPVTIRLLDPPLHEFLPHGSKGLDQLARQMELEVTELMDKVESLVEVNPMLGHRGCRLGVTAPEIYDMQVEAIARAACACAKNGDEAPRPEIMVPLVGVEGEISRLRRRIADTVEKICLDAGVMIEIPIGTMIEVPRAALIANRIALFAEFFSFGTNDLTQMTYGYSRDDVGRFLPEYVEKEIVGVDPFARLDTEGVGELVKIASERGRMARPDLKLGICGEHGGDPHSIEFFERCGLDYISCSPYRLPVARLAAARARLAYGAGDEE